MSRMRRFIVALLFSVLLLASGRPAFAVAEAGEAYVMPTFQELVQTIVVLGGLDLKNTNVLDDYIKLMYCDLYKENYKDDFALNKLENQVFARVTSKREYSRSLYQLIGRVELGKYDMDRQQFPFVGGTGFQNVGSLLLLQKVKDKLDSCISIPGQSPSTGIYFPDSFDLRLGRPFNLMYFKSEAEEAKKILERMRKMKITDRKLFIRLRFRVQSMVDGAKKGDRQAHLAGEVVDVDLFYDQEMTQLVGNISMK